MKKNNLYIHKHIFRNSKNMRKLLTLLIGAVLCAATLTAQNSTGDLFTVTGQVIDSLDNEPVPFATVAVAFTQTPTQFVRAVVCDGNGKFEIQIQAPGNYIMNIQSIVITTLMKPLTLTETNRKIDLGIIYVHGRMQELGEVVVAAQKPLVKVEIDKLIYNIQEDPEAKVNNTLDMLRKVPMVTVDGDDKIQLKGSSNFRIYLNGKPSNMLSGQNVSDVLKSMPANSIKDIEVITDPGARYDAEGIGGIINIITARNTLQGFQGSVSANAGTFGSFGGGTTLTAKIGKLGLNGNFNYSNSKRPWSMSESISENFINERYYMENNMGRNKYDMIYNMGRLEVSYELDTLNLFSLGVNSYGGKQNNKSEMELEMLNKTGNMEYGYDRYSDGIYNYGSTGINFDYQRSTRKKDEFFTFSYRFNQSPDGSENYSYVRNIVGIENVPSHIKLDQWNNNDAKTTEHTGQIDYVNPLNQKHSIEAGLKYILRQNASNVTQYIKDASGNWEELPTASSNDFLHTSDIYAAYAGYAFKSAKVGVRTGLRAEGTKQNVKFRLDENRNFGTDYFNLVPSATVSYQLKPTQQLRLGYNLRIYRPSIWYLNPYVNDTDPYNILYGNPELVPEKSHSFNANYSYFSPKITLNISASYSYVNNAIERYSFIDETDINVKQNTYGNIGSSQRSGVYVNAGWTPNKVLRINLNGGLNYASLKSAELDASNSGLTGNIFANTQLTLPKDFRINVSGMYYSGFIMLQGNQSSQHYITISANKDFLEKKMTVSFSLLKPFMKNLEIESSTSNEFFYNKYISQYPMREARIGISYRFGSMKEAIKKVQRGISNDDVKSGGDSGSSGSTGM